MIVCMTHLEMNIAWYRYLARWGTYLYPYHVGRTWTYYFPGTWPVGKVLSCARRIRRRNDCYMKGLFICKKGNKYYMSINLHEENKYSMSDLFIYMREKYFMSGLYICICEKQNC